MAKFFYSDTFDVDLGEKHRFPIRKYRMLREKLLSDEVIENSQLVESHPISEEKLLLAHEESYVRGVLDLSLDAKQARPIGLPLTREMVHRAIVSMNASFLAANSALVDGISGALSSGTHHAGHAKGEGFCFFNDFAVIAREHANKKILIIDLDVHQGNGNGDILKNDSHVTILDIFCEGNYPFRKNISNYGYAVGLEREVGDDQYLQTLEHYLTKLPHDVDLVLYQAGVDVLANDEFGKLSLTYEGVGQRDQMVFDFVKKIGAPVSFVIGGGYGKDISQTVAAYAQTFQIAKKVIGF